MGRTDCARCRDTFEPPEIVRKLTIFGDNDRNYRGQKAAYVLANRLAVDKHREISVEVLLPPTPGQDWLDVLNSRRA